MTPNFCPEQAANLLLLMANEVRLRVFFLILEKEWAVTALASAVNLSQSALSQHLKKLRDAKIVSVRRDAQTIYYSCNSEAVIKVCGTLNEIFQTGNSVRSAV
ncbi:metalloregulator ArsR/SmtB family transcription factor [Rhizobium sp. XQZ8]|uniref:ArsR/SmtB family transcription factor n=1 Tax=Rhizobium populisoli TaxID=2859785 RepID=UPI001CA5B0B0|nr:metalloregulator ArsR/SmtB family transcription factor [Rhizobium populisoli]MBW6422165.1 metalloregulator ArsR/SmtB family transcription factor [Rhizobium populisoli]